MKWIFGNAGVLHPFTRSFCYLDSTKNTYMCLLIRVKVSLRRRPNDFWDHAERLWRFSPKKMKGFPDIPAQARWRMSPYLCFEQCWRRAWCWVACSCRAMFQARQTGKSRGLLSKNSILSTVGLLFADMWKRLAVTRGFYFYLSHGQMLVSSTLKLTGQVILFVTFF